MVQFFKMYESYINLKTGFDGIVGLAYPSMAAYNFNPLFDNIIQEKKLKSNQFSFYMSN